MAPSLSIVIFGASGDLTGRKLVPALFQLARKGRLPEEAKIVGVARSSFNDVQFRAKLGKGLIDQKHDIKAWNEFATKLYYVPGDAAQPGGLESLSKWFDEHEAGSDARRLYYLAVAPDLYPAIVTQLGEVGMADEKGGWRRIIIEKPFGNNLTSSRELNRIVHTHFHEDQIYRIDHYLGKETVQNMLVFRFANTIFEPLWNHNYIDHVQITVAEDGKVGRRANYYDKAGVLRDMFQSHLLQLLALVAMEAPARFAANQVRNEKIKVLEAIPVLGLKEAAAQVVCGQYVSYTDEPGVARNTRTPTFAALRLQIDNWRWQGVPFYLRSGKGLASRSSEIVIQFRCVPHMMFATPTNSALQCNRLGICIQPDEGIHLNFQSKVPDEGMTMQAADLMFHFADIYAKKELPEAYERLLQDAISGDATLFMRSDEIERAWEIIDPLVASSEAATATPPEQYAVGSNGPQRADEFLKADHREWISMCKH